MITIIGALVETAFEATKGIIKNHFHAIVIHGSFVELNRALLEFSQNGLFPKIRFVLIISFMATKKKKRKKKKEF